MNFILCLQLTIKRLFLIYNLLTPVALAHFIKGDGSARDYGLTLCTGCYTVLDVVRLMNVLVIRYNLKVTLQKKKEESVSYIY